MKTSMKACAVAATIAALGLGLVGCGSDTKTAESTSTKASSSSSTTSSKSKTSAPSSTAAPAGANESIADYIKSAGITETAVKRGDPGSPTIDLPIPAGWEDVGADTPEWAWGAIKFSDAAAAADPPTIVALVSKLTGPVDPAKIFEYAPGELNNLEGFDGPKEAQKSNLGGFEAVQLGGTYVKDGVTRLIAQKTVVIPVADGMYVLQLNADGIEEFASPLMDATADIDENTTITLAP